MIPKVDQKVANLNPKGTTSEPNADRNASKHRCCSKITFGEVRDKGFGTLWAPLDRFGLPFCRPLSFAGVPKSTSGSQKQHKIASKGAQEGVLEKHNFRMDF